MNEILRYLAAASEKHTFSDAHIEQDRPLKLRLPGGWDESDYGLVTQDDLRTFLEAIDPAWKPKLNKGMSLSKTIDLADMKMADIRYRCFAYTIDGGNRVAASMRPIRRMPISLEKLGLPPLALTFAKSPKGLLLVTGPTGSGKTTTIMALLTKILSTRRVHAVTIEDPIEYILSEGEGITSQREVGIDTVSFAEGLKEAVRQRPDVIMVGEIRDHDTAATALRAAESGHFVVATMHARSAVGALQKLKDMAAADSSAIGYALIGVLAQTLVPAKDGSALVLGCELLNCLEREVQGKVIEQKWSALEDMLKRGEKGCVSLNKSLSELIKRNIISREDALTAAYDPATISSQLL